MSGNRGGPCSPRSTDVPRTCRTDPRSSEGLRSPCPPPCPATTSAPDASARAPCPSPCVPPAPSVAAGPCSNPHEPSRQLPYSTPADAYGSLGIGGFKPKRTRKLFGSPKRTPINVNDEDEPRAAPQADPCSQRTCTQPFTNQLHIGAPIPFKRISDNETADSSGAAGAGRVEPFLHSARAQETSSAPPAGSSYPSSSYPYPPPNPYPFPSGSGGGGPLSNVAPRGVSDLSKIPVNLQFSVHGTTGAAANTTNKGVISLTVNDSGGPGGSRSRSGSLASVDGGEEDAVVALPLAGAFKVSAPGTLPEMEGNFKISSPKTTPKIEGNFNISGGGVMGNLAGQFSVNLPSPIPRRLSIDSQAASSSVISSGVSAGTFGGAAASSTFHTSRDDSYGSGSPGSMRSDAGSPKCDATFDAGAPRYDATYVNAKLRPDAPNVGPCATRAVPPVISPYDAPPANSSQARALMDLTRGENSSFIPQPSSAVLRGIPTSGLPNIGDQVPPTPADQRLPETPAPGYHPVMIQGMTPDLSVPFFGWQRSYVEMLERVIVEDPELQKIRAQYQVPALFGQQNIGIQNLPLTAGKPGIAVPADSTDSGAPPWCAEISGIEEIKEEPPCNPECCPKVIQVIGFVGITEPN